MEKRLAEHLTQESDVHVLTFAVKISFGCFLIELQIVFRGPQLQANLVKDAAKHANNIQIHVHQFKCSSEKKAIAVKFSELRTFGHIVFLFSSAHNRCWYVLQEYITSHALGTRLHYI